MVILRIKSPFLFMSVALREWSCGFKAKYFLHNFAILFMVNNYVLYCSHNTYNLKCYLETDRQKWLNDVN